MDRLVEKCGMISVFLILVLGSIMAAVFIFIAAASDKAEESMAKGYIHLAGRSSLSEYHVSLKERYSLFATDLTVNQLDHRMTFYLRENFLRQKTLRMELDQIDIKNREFSLGNADLFEQQLIDGVCYPPSHGLISELQIFNAEWVDVYGWGILPSNGSPGYSINLTHIRDYFSQKNSLLSLKPNAFNRLEYIHKYFNHHKKEPVISNSYFLNEAEYILYGFPCDEKNLNRFQRDFIAVRTLLNLIHIKEDPEKMRTLYVAASLLTPGPKVVATQLALAGLWAGFEASNDWKLLVENQGVEPLKAKEHWALTFEGMADKSPDEAYVRPKIESDVHYQEYLDAFLLIQNRENQLLRMLDLIQINICCMTESHFLIQECFTGFSYDIVINGKSYHGTETY
jgi:hypothetical protein